MKHINHHFFNKKTHKTACTMTVSYMFFSLDQLRGPAPKMGNTILDQNLVTESSPPTAPIFDLTLKKILMDPYGL